MKSYSTTLFSHFLRYEASKDANLDALMVDKTKLNKKQSMAAHCGRISHWVPYILEKGLEMFHHKFIMILCTLMSNCIEFVFVLDLFVLPLFSRFCYMTLECCAMEVNLIINWLSCIVTDIWQFNFKYSWLKTEHYFLVLFYLLFIWNYFSQSWSKKTKKNTTSITYCAGWMSCTEQTYSASFSVLCRHLCNLPLITLIHLVQCLLICSR